MWKDFKCLVSKLNYLPHLFLDYFSLTHFLMAARETPQPNSSSIGSFTNACDKPLNAVHKSPLHVSTVKLSNSGKMHQKSGQSWMVMPTVMHGNVNKAEV